MKLKTGNMWSAFPHVDLFLVTTNSTIRKDGALVMGRGIAREAAQRFPRLPYSLGGAIERLSEGDGRHVKYGILVPKTWPSVKIGAFQVKYYWGDQASPSLIRFSTDELIDWCAKNPTAQVHLNFPGIGNGGLTPEQVLPIISRLPDTVTVWRRKEPTHETQTCPPNRRRTGRRR